MSARDLQKSLRRLIGGDRGYTQLGAQPPVGARPGGVSVGRPGGSASGASGFAESDYALREYWSERIAATSSDGLFVMLDEPIKLIALEGDEVATFREPPV